MKRLMTILSIAVSLFFAGCGGGTSSTTTSTTGTVALSLTDAPVDDENIKSVYVTFTGLRYQYADSNDSNDGWQDVDLNGSRTVDLLALQDGNTTLLSEVELPAGEISHVRFVLDTSKCYIEFEVGDPVDMIVPSGDQTGYKAIGGFTIAAGGIVNVTADFDLRKSLTHTGSSTNNNSNDKYLLNPTIKIVDNITIGEINGTMNLDANGSSVIVYAYADGKFDETQEVSNDFSGAVTSTDATNGNYTLPWLASGTYDLVVVSYTVDGTYESILGYVNDVTVTAESVTVQDITLDTLSDTLL